MSPLPLISVVVTTYNRSEALVPVLAALARQSDQHFEIIIADDGSKAAHQARVARCAKDLGVRITQVWHPDVGFTAARVRNLGVAASAGHYLVFLDGDCVPERDFIAQHRRLMESDCFVNGSRVLLSPALTQSVISGDVTLSGRGAGFWLKARISGAASKLTGLIRLPDGAYRKHPNFVWKGIRSCNMGVWKQDFERINGFDESFVGWGHEDADFVLRLHNSGLVRKNGFCATEVYHLWHKESNRDMENANADKVRARALTKEIMPTFGYRDGKGGSDVVVQTLG